MKLIDVHRWLRWTLTYKYGDDGFITMSKSHWLFDKKQD